MRINYQSYGIALKHELRNEKYIHISLSKEKATVCIPMPEGGYERKDFHFYGSILARSYDLREYRDRRGLELWGAYDWERLMRYKKRPVKRYAREEEPGVTHTVTKVPGPNGTVYEYKAWTVTWTEDDPLFPGTHIRRARAKRFGYGGANSKFSQSSDAEVHAHSIREEMYEKHYIPYRKTIHRLKHYEAPQQEQVSA